ncbi:MAG: aspartate carbamoyltransferase regulatory subunit [Thermoplasmata archaeon]|nr:aspartate carbamoyltransferase regulatory subunit [Thermoplasmata archaeon]
MTEKYMKVQRIENGTVIDHIPAGRALDVLSILKVAEGLPMSILVNAHSKLAGRKDILKVEDLELTRDEVNRVALIAPEATINIIRDGEVAEKFRVEAPKRVQNVVRCSNPNCISNQKEPVVPEVRLAAEAPHRYVCAYCEREVDDLSGHLCS